MRAKIDEKALKALIRRRRGTEHVHNRPAAGDEGIDDREGFEAQWGEPRMSASMTAEPAARLLDHPRILRHPAYLTPAGHHL